MEDMRKPRTSKYYPALDCSPVLSNQVNYEILVKQLKDYGQTSKQQLNRLIDSCEHILYNQPNVLSLSSPIRIVGDIHGQFHDLLYILEHYGSFPQDKFLFLGDYVDRGHFCIQVITVLMALKCKYPKNIYLLRGNHQGKTMTEHFNFKLQCIKKYDYDIYERFIQLFCKLPLCAIVDGRYFCVHGGISPELKKIKDLLSVDRFKEIEQGGLICDMLWSDPGNTNVAIWQKNKARSCSYVFSKKHSQRFITENKLEMIIRGHQVQMKGFSYQLSQLRKKLTLTLFSAPNYCDTYKNKGCVAIIQKDSLVIESFQQSPHPFVFPNYMNILEWSLPIIGTKTSHLFLHLLKMIDGGEKQSVSEDQADVVNKLRCLSSLLESKNAINFQLLLNPSKEENVMEEDFEKLFTIKKVNDQCERYPHNPPPVIGPKRLQFKKVQVASMGDEEDVLPLTKEKWDSKG